MKHTLLILSLVVLYSIVFGQNSINQYSEGESIIQTSIKVNRFKVSILVKDLGIPWGMTFLSPTELLFTEKNGRIGIISTNNGKIVWVSGGPVVENFGQGGLLDVATEKGFKSGDWIYFTYVKGKTLERSFGEEKFNHIVGVTTLARAKLKGSKLFGFEDLLVTKSESKSYVHFGSRIAFDGDGNLFFTVGDRGLRKSSQDLLSHSGSIIRIGLNGSIPKGNPFLGYENALPEIWSYGHRNPQGIFFDIQKNRLWSIEHGPKGGDEINLIYPGFNYGWPIISFGYEYGTQILVGEGTHKEGLEQPIKYFSPSIAPSSLIVYSGTAFPEWKGNLFSGALKLAHINRIEIGHSNSEVIEERLLESFGERIRNIIESPEGWLYFSTDSGKIMRISN